MFRFGPQLGCREHNRIKRLGRLAQTMGIGIGQHMSAMQPQDPPPRASGNAPPWARARGEGAADAPAPLDAALLDTIDSPQRRLVMARVASFWAPGHERLPSSTVIRRRPAVLSDDVIL